MLKLNIWGVATIMCFLSSALAADPADALTGEQLLTIDRAVRKDPKFETYSAKAEGKPLYLCSGWLQSPDSNGKRPAGPKLIELLYYQYSTGRTVRVIVEQNGGITIKSIEDLEAYPTPLAAEELERAVALSREKVSAVQYAYLENGPRIHFDYLVKVIADPKDPQYGHRIVLLMFQAGKRKGKDILTVEVDLTNENARRP